MIRQAHTYLVGALSGVTLIGIAIIVFVVLVSTQVFHDWPIAEVGAGAQKGAVAPAKALRGAGNATASTAPAAGAGAAKPQAAKAGVGTTVQTKRAVRHHGAANAGVGQVATATPSAPTTETAPSTGGNESGGGNSGSKASPPSSSSLQQSSSTQSGGGSGGSSSSSVSGGSSGTGAPATGSSGSSGGGSGSTAPTTTPPVVATTKPSQTVTEAVNGTVGSVDEKVLGGTLEKAGVTPVTEEVVNGVAGPESAVGKTVDGVGELVGGLLGGGGH